MISKSLFLSYILPFTLSQEGGYSNNRYDSGGETYRGISRVKNPTWSGWQIVDRFKPLKRNQVIEELEGSVKEFYYTNYFLAPSFNSLNSKKVALSLFDFHVNGGLSLAWLKSEIKRRFGKTFKNNTELFCYINTLNENYVSKLILDKRKSYFDNLSKSSKYARFGVGWNKRLIALKAYLNIAYIATGGAIILVIIFYLIFRRFKNGTI